MTYPYDPDLRAYVAELLYAAVPAYFRTFDAPPSGRGELGNLLAVLAAPLAIARQNIEEMHAGLFIDTADDWLLRYFAGMVGSTLIFPDAASNRRDIRSTVAFRRRKGTPLMLQDMGETLTGQMVVTQEGWRLVQMTQDLNLLRRDRLIPDVRPAILAETESGPLCSTHHLPDLRAISRTSGVFHPKHVAHWAHPTLLFPIDDATPFDLRDPVTDPDLRFAFHPSGAFEPLRARRTSSSDTAIRTDRVPPMHFAAAPATWFGRDGRFSVTIGGVAAAVAEPAEQARLTSNRTAGVELASGAVELALLDHEPRAFRATVRVEFAMVSLVAGLPDTANAASVDVRARMDISAAGSSNVTVVSAAAPDAARVPMLRLTPPAGGAPSFPGAVVGITGASPASALSPDEDEARRQGFLRGTLAVRIPASPVAGDRWFFIAIDGSCYEAQTTGAGPADVPVTVAGDLRTLPRDRFLTQGPGPAWPPTPPLADPVPLERLPNAPGRGPLILHGGRVLRPSGNSFTPVPAGASCALVFALRAGAFTPEFHPFLRLAWNGADPSAATWTSIDDASAATPLDPRLAAIAALREAFPGDVRLLVRFECSLPNARMAPCETAWSGYDGVSTLLYLPELHAQPANPLPQWPLSPSMAAVSPACAAAADGSTWDELMAANLRQSLGDLSPLAEPLSLRRRIVRGRRLCGWRNEQPPLQMMAAASPRTLEIDVDNGLFALSAQDAVRAWPLGPEGAPAPPSLGVSYQDGYSSHCGARGAARQPLLADVLPEPTRIVSASGRLRPNAPASLFNLPRHRSLAEALSAIAINPASDEIVEFQDSATYSQQILTWPAGPATLRIRAAERERPVVVVSSWNLAAGAAYSHLELLGIALASASPGEFAFPPSQSASLLYCSVLREDMALRFTLTGAAGEDIAHVTNCVAGPLRLNGSGELRIRNSVIDSGPAAPPAVAANAGAVTIDRSTVFGRVTARTIDASESIFQNRIVVTDRFSGCVRYSRVTADSVLPRRHRVAIDTPLNFGSLARHSPAHARLAASADPRILAGAEDGGEMGAFHDNQLALRYEGYRRRLEESTPAGLITGIIRLD